MVSVDQPQATPTPAPVYYADRQQGLEPETQAAVQTPVSAPGFHQASMPVFRAASPEPQPAAPQPTFASVLQTAIRKPETPAASSSMAEHSSAQEFASDEDEAELVPVAASVFDDDFFVRGRRHEEEANEAPVLRTDVRVPTFGGLAPATEPEEPEHDELDIPAFLRRGNH